MKTSAEGVAFIAAAEGVVTRAYRDVAGVFTIGVGHTAAAGTPIPVRGLAISRDEALAILARDLPQYEARVAAHVAPLTQTVFDGAVSFDFNTGAIDRASWVTAFQSGDLAGARQRLMLWTKAAGRTVVGLTRRRKAEARLIFDGDYGLEQPGAPQLDAALNEIRAQQADLATLGFYKGAIDGIAGPTMTAAILAYQKSHPDLVADGVAGPATFASIARDIAARRNVGTAIGAAAASAASAGAGVAGIGGARPLLVAIVVGVGVLAVFGGFVALRYRDELKRAALPAKET
jgi:lysozyme